MFYKEIIGRELYLYYNGVLIYKRWFDYGYGRVFHENEGLTHGKVKNNKTRDNRSMARDR